MILLNIQDPDDFSGPEDNTLVRNALAIEDNPYQSVGLDANADNRRARRSFSFNFFRLGEEREENPFTSVQRRIVIVDGSTSELLFSLTPTGSSSGSVVPDIQARENEFISIINSIMPAPVTDPEITITTSRLSGSSFVIGFTSSPAQTNFTVLSGDSPDNLTQNLSSQTDISESEPGEYQATISLETPPTRAFFQLLSN